VTSPGISDVHPSQLVEHPCGHYRFLPGITPYSCGVVASPGYEIVHVTLDKSLPWRTGFRRIADFIDSQLQPRSALCAIELRSPAPFTFAGFAQFNGEYTELLRDWGIFVNGMNPVARTNVAPEFAPPAEPNLHAFSFTKPAADSPRPTFVVAGAGELPEGALERERIVALGNRSPSGLRTKAEFVLGLMQHRLAGLGVNGEHVTGIDVYTLHDIHRLMKDPLLDRLPAACRFGVQWHYARPPIIDIEFEMDLRGVRTELRI
jgi:hypothetical protein